MLVDACHAGDARACWRAEMVHRHDNTGRGENDDAGLRLELVTAIAAHCAAGDDTSCRVVSAGPPMWETFIGNHAEDQCTRGVAAACLALGLDITDDDRRTRAPDKPTFVSDAEVARRSVWLDRGCKLGNAQSCRELRTPEMKVKALALAGAECQRGWVESCWLLHDLHDDARNSGGAVADETPVWQAAARSCHDGLLTDCGRALDEPAPVSTKIAALAQLCAPLGAGCSALGALRLAAGPDQDRDAARTAYEQGCEAGDDFTCLDLAEHYLDKTLAEPVAGRGHDLAAFLCERPDASWDLVSYNGMPFAHAREHAVEIACRLRDGAPGH